MNFHATSGLPLSPAARACGRRVASPGFADSPWATVSITAPSSQAIQKKCCLRRG